MKVLILSKIKFLFPNRYIINNVLPDIKANADNEIRLLFLLPNIVMVTRKPKKDKNRTYIKGTSYPNMLDSKKVHPKPYINIDSIYATSNLQSSFS